jgi:hypothetical protein
VNKKKNDCNEIGGLRERTWQKKKVNKKNDCNDIGGLGER